MVEVARQRLAGNTVVVPVGVIKLNEAHAALDQTPGEQAVIGKRRLAGNRSIELERRLSLRCQIDQFRSTRLHPCRDLVGGDPRGDLGVGRHLEPRLVEGDDRIDRPPLTLRRNPCRGGQVQDWLASAPERHSLIGRGKKPASPVDRPASRSPRARLQHHEAGQICRPGAYCIRHPGAHAGPPELRCAGIGKELGRRMIEDVGRSRLHDRQIVDNFSHVRQEIRNPRTRLAVPGERAIGSQQFRMLFCEHIHEREAPALDERVRNRPAAKLLKLRLEIEQLELAGAAGHEQVNHALCPRRKMPGLGRERVATSLGGRHRPVAGQKCR